jgi:Ser/Thr protein kinase RdoA (MazF antagonist)
LPHEFKDDFAMSATVKVHGMDGTLVKPDWPPLTLAEVRALLANFPALTGPIEILSVSPRPLSAAGVVSTTSGRVFIKRHHRTVRNVEGLLEEHRFLAHLHAAGAEVPRILPSISGQTAIAMDEWTYEVHEIPVGIDLYEEAISWTPFRTPAHAYSAGQALARLHRAAQGFDAPLRKPRPLVASFTIFAAKDPGVALEQYLAARPTLASNAAVRVNCKQALQLLAPFHAQLLPLLPALSSLWTHNDLHASNLFWSDLSDDAHATAVIDFGLADRTNAVHDFANAIERNIVEWLVLVSDPAHPDDVPIHLDHLHALLDGYESVRPLSEHEAAALAPMTALCHAEFALSEAEYFLAALHSHEKASMAYDGWLVGHARWFRSSPGRKLLDAIQHWAATRNQRQQRAGVL